MPDAARVGDKTAHNGQVTGPGCQSVKIGGQNAACVGDDHTCPLHRGGPILPPGSASVFIGGKPAARVGDKAQCGSGEDVITEGFSRVQIGG